MLTTTSSLNRLELRLAGSKVSTDATVPCWILEPVADRFLAVGNLEVVHLIPNPVLHTVPLTPAHANKVTIWGNTVLPVINLSLLLGLGSSHSDANYLIVVGYYTKNQDEVRYGALALADLPRRIQVSDDNASKLPDDGVNWFDVAHSCIAYQEQIIPILQLQMIFSPHFTNAKDI
jgi:chemotaxis signal transduction protein